MYKKCIEWLPGKMRGGQGPVSCVKSLVFFTLRTDVLFVCVVYIVLWFV